MIYKIYLYILCQTTLAALKDEVVSVENELLELQEVEKQQKALIEVYKTQVTIAFILMLNFVDSLKHCIFNDLN